MASKTTVCSPAKIKINNCLFISEVILIIRNNFVKKQRTKSVCLKVSPFLLQIFFRVVDRKVLSEQTKRTSIRRCFVCMFPAVWWWEWTVINCVTLSPAEGVYPHYINRFTRAHLLQNAFHWRTTTNDSKHQRDSLASGFSLLDALQPYVHKKDTTSSML